MNVSSIIVKTNPEDFPSVLRDLKASGLCEVHFYDCAGKIVVTVEGESISEEMNKVKSIMKIPGVFCADLAYSYSEKELEDALERLNNLVDAVPEVLKSGYGS